MYELPQACVKVDLQPGPKALCAGSAGCRPFSVPITHLCCTAYDRESEPNRSQFAECGSTVHDVVQNAEIERVRAGEVHVDPMRTLAHD